MIQKHIASTGGMKCLVSAGLTSAFGFSAVSAVPINVDAIGINITNTTGNANDPLGVLVPFVYQGGDFAPSNSSAATRLDWLNSGGTYDPGQIEGYNLIAGGSLAQAGTNVINDDHASASESYSLTPGFTYYLTAHYGGYYVAWAFDATVADATYNAPGSIKDVLGTFDYDPSMNGGGLSNIRAWRGASLVMNGAQSSSVPDGGATIVSLGVALLGLGSIRRLIVAKA